VVGGLAASVQRCSARGTDRHIRTQFGIERISRLLVPRIVATTVRNGSVLSTLATTIHSRKSNS
jgi:hypothetical protein